jgi:hypothetical protein
VHDFLAIFDQIVAAAGFVGMALAAAIVKVVVVPAEAALVAMAG